MKFDFVIFVQGQSSKAKATLAALPEGECKHLFFYSGFGSGSFDSSLLFHILESLMENILRSFAVLVVVHICDALTQY